MSGRVGTRPRLAAGRARPLERGAQFGIVLLLGESEDVRAPLAEEARRGGDRPRDRGRSAVRSNCMSTCTHSSAARRMAVTRPTLTPRSVNRGTGLRPPTSRNRALFTIWSRGQARLRERDARRRPPARTAATTVTPTMNSRRRFMSPRCRRRSTLDEPGNDGIGAPAEFVPVPMARRRPSSMHRDAVSDTEARPQVVGDDQPGGAEIARAHHQVVDHRRRDRVELVRRLVIQM